MKMWMTLIGVAAAVLFTINQSSAQTAGPGTGPGSMHHQERAYGSGHGGMYHQEGMMSGKDFSLTPEQKTAFRELRRRFKLENAQLIGALVAKRIELRVLWTDPKADLTVIAEKEKELGSIQFQMREKAVQFRLEARKYLTPEQINKFGDRWGMGRHYGHGRMMGHKDMVEHEGMMEHQGMMRGGKMKHRGGMMEDGGDMGSEKGPGMMKHGMGGRGGRGMCK